MSLSVPPFVVNEWQWFAVRVNVHDLNQALFLLFLSLSPIKTKYHKQTKLRGGGGGNIFSYNLANLQKESQLSIASKHRW